MFISRATLIPPDDVEKSKRKVEIFLLKWWKNVFQGDRESFLLCQLLQMLHKNIHNDSTGRKSIQIIFDCLTCGTWTQLVSENGTMSVVESKWIFNFHFSHEQIYELRKENLQTFSIFPPRLFHPNNIYMRARLNNFVRKTRLQIKVMKSSIFTHSTDRPTPSQSREYLLCAEIYEKSWKLNHRLFPIVPSSFFIHQIQFVLISFNRMSNNSRAHIHPLLNSSKSKQPQ